MINSKMLKALYNNITIYTAPIKFKDAMYRYIEKIKAHRNNTYYVCVRWVK